MSSIPITILAGSDMRPGAAEGAAAGLHPLAAYKGATLQVDGRPLAAVLCERITAARGLGPARIAGPRRVYEPIARAHEFVDTDGSVGENLRAAIDHHARASDGPMGLLATDVLPTVEDLEALRESFGTAPRSALWFPLVRRPEDESALGAFAWKPSYPIRPGPAAPPVRVLPGHLAFFDPAALRLPLLYALLDSAYRARNRSISAKRRAMLASVLAGLLKTDLRLLAGLRAPTRTASVLSCGLGIARKLLANSLTLPELETAVGRIIVRRSVQRALEQPIRLPLLDDLWLAEDVDTDEEQRALEETERHPSTVSE